MPSNRIRKAIVIAAIALLLFTLLACSGDATCSPQNNGSRAAAMCVTQ